MTSIIILIVVILVTFYLGKFALREGQRIENHKKFINDMEKFGKKDDEYLNYWLKKKKKNE